MIKQMNDECIYQELSTTLNSNNQIDISLQNKQNILIRQKERLKNRYDKIIKNYELEISKLNKKLQMRDKQIKQLFKQNNKFKIINQQISNQLDHKSKNIIHLQNQYQKCYDQINKKQNQIKSFKTEIIRLNGQIYIQRQKLQNSQKQYKINLRRQKAVLQQARMKIQSKLNIVQRYQQKTQSILDKKKQQLNQIVEQKNEQIKQLRQQINLLRNDIQNIKNDYEKDIKKRMQDYKQIQQDLKIVLCKNVQQKNRFDEYDRKIKNIINLLKSKLDLKSDDDDIFKLINKLIDEIISRDDRQQYLNEIIQLKKRIQQKIINEKELINKKCILQQQIIFYKNQLKNKKDFNHILKDHMKQIDFKIINQNQLKKQINYSILKSKNILNSIQNQNQQNIDKIISKQVSFLEKSKHYSLLSILQNIPQGKKSNHTLSTLSKTFTNKKVYNNKQNTNIKSANDFIKQQLNNKKKSLIYVMYKKQDDSQNINQTLIKLKKQNLNKITSNRKRSNSMNNLISNRCREQII